MQPILRYAWLFIFIAVAIVTLAAAIEKNDFAGLEEPYYLVLYLLSLLSAFPVFFYWLNYYRQKKKSWRCLPFFLPVVFGVLLIAVNIFRSYRRNVPVFLKAGIEGLSVELRTDHT